MKKMSMLFVFSFFSLILFTGCQSQSSESTKDLQNQIAQLEQQIADLKSQQFNNTTGNSPEASTSETTPSDTAQQTKKDAPVPEESNVQNSKTIEEITALVDAFSQKVDTVRPSGTESEQKNQFFTLKSELDSIELEMDRYEVLMEADFRAGTLSADDYYVKERDLERLEDKLDLSEDTLEVLFGIDD